MPKKKKVVRKKRAAPKKRKPVLKKKPAPRKKPAAPKKKPSPKKKPAAPKPKAPGKVIGVVTHYFPHVMAAVVKLKAPLSLGDTLKIKGHTTDFTQQVTSMQIDHVPVTTAKTGAEIGLLVNSRVRQHDLLYKI